MNKAQDKKDWYCIKFDLPKNKNMTALKFSQKMNDFLEQINEFNHSIVASYIEDFEAGSVEWWLLDKLNKTDDEALEKEEGKIVAENIVDKFLILLTPTAKKNCMWEFEDESKIKCAIEDEQFFNDYKDGKIALHGKEVMKVKLKTVQKLLEGNKIKNEYFAIKIEVIHE